jgi:hypothetical protein
MLDTSYKKIPCKYSMCNLLYFYFKKALNKVKHYVDSILMDEIYFYQVYL